MEAAPHSGLNFALKLDSVTVGRKCIVCVHTMPCSLVAIALCMPVAVDYSVADRFLPEPCQSDPTHAVVKVLSIHMMISQSFRVFSRNHARDVTSATHRRTDRTNIKVLMLTLSPVEACFHKAHINLYGV